MVLKRILLWMVCLPLTAAGQGNTDGMEGYGAELAQLVDSLALTNQIHGPYVGFSGEPSAQYLRFERLTDLADCGALRILSTHGNAVVRGYAFWALARKQYPKLDSLLLAHARDEEIISEIQGSVITQLPLIEFMQWVVDPEIMDGDSKKLNPEVIRKVADLRFAEK